MAKPIDFKESNILLNVCEEHKKQGVLPIRIARVKYADDIEAVVECWKLTLRERLLAVLFGKVWVSIMVDVRHVPPIYIECSKTFLNREATEGDQ